MLSVPLAAVILASCAVSGGSPLGQLTSEDQLVTGSVAMHAKPEGVSETDVNVIKSAVITAKDISETNPLGWRNPETGSSGAIVSIDTFMGKHGQHCRGFKTTVSNFAGVSFYNGETCKIDDDRWVLSWFKPSS